MNIFFLLKVSQCLFKEKLMKFTKNMEENGLLKNRAEATATGY